MNLEYAASISDLRELARQRLPKMVFDYIDGAAGDELTATRNRQAFNDIHLNQSALVDVSVRDSSTRFFGEMAALPLIVGPTGLNGAFWPKGDLALARAAAQAKIPFVLSTAATDRLDTVLQAAGPLRWFQLYMMKDRQRIDAFLQRVHDEGFNVLQLTIDTSVAGRRNRDIRNGFTLPFRWTLKSLFDSAVHPRWALSMLRCGMPTLRLFEDIAGKPPHGKTISDVMQQQLASTFTWADLAWLRSVWKGKLVVKGISSPAQACQAIDVGVDGVVVSNHGGRQLDSVRSTIEWLPGIVAAIDGRCTILVDSGFRSGTDIAKAIALGADGIQLGRATLYGLAAAGERGVLHALSILRSELDRTMALSGARSLVELRGCLDPGHSATGIGSSSGAG